MSHKKALSTTAKGFFRFYIQVYPLACHSCQAVETQNQGLYRLYYLSSSTTTEWGGRDILSWLPRFLAPAKAASRTVSGWSNVL